MIFHKTSYFKVIKFIIGYAESVDKGLGFSKAKYNVLTVCKTYKKRRMFQRLFQNQ